MKTLITFADLTYTEKGMSSNAFPYASGVIASYAKRFLGDEIEVEIFKYPDDFKNYLEKNNPQIICFTNYSWTLDISHEFAKKIKKKFPKTISIFGGPNYPNELNLQKDFLKTYSAIDFYIKGEGEIGFVNLFKNLKKFNFDSNAIKKNKIKLGNCHYLNDEEVIIGENLSRVENLNDIPSPYLSGMFDKFFDKKLIPSIQTSRGCPFKCDFCQEGKDYFNKICKFSLDRIIAEIEYISERVQVPNLYVLDSNFGMYKQDVEIAKAVMAVKRKKGWPKYFEAANGKSKKVMDVIQVLEGSFYSSVAIQSTDPEVLKNVRRKNVPDETVEDILKFADKRTQSSFSEIILCLPGDTLEKHSRSMFDMINRGVNVVRSHQLLLLPDSLMYSKDYRKKHGMETRFRLQPKCFGNYKLYGESFPCAEIDEVCVSNNTMTYEDYLKSRFLDLTVEIFYNNGVFKEYVNFLNEYNINASNLLKTINEYIPQSQLNNLYKGFLKENEECLWKNKTELEQFIKTHKTIDRFIEKDLRANEQLTYRAMAFFDEMEELHNIVFKCTKDLLSEKSILDNEKEIYLKQLTRFSLLRKNNLRSLNKTATEQFNYDFTKISKNNFNESPLSLFKTKEVKINFSHTKEQQKNFLNYTHQFGSSIPNLGAILSRSSVNTFYRNVKLSDN